MRFVLSIILLLITACYILPVKEIIKAENISAVTDMDEEKTEHEKKEKSKELFSLFNSGFFINEANTSLHQHIIFSIPLTLHRVVSPPPDTKG